MMKRRQAYIDWVWMPIRMKQITWIGTSACVRAFCRCANEIRSTATFACWFMHRPQVKNARKVEKEKKKIDSKENYSMSKNKRSARYSLDLSHSNGTHSLWDSLSKYSIVLHISIWFTACVPLHKYEVVYGETHSTEHRSKWTRWRKMETISTKRDMMCFEVWRKTSEFTKFTCLFYQVIKMSAKKCGAFAHTSTSVARQPSFSRICADEHTIDTRSMHEISKKKWNGGGERAGKREWNRIQFAGWTNSVRETVIILLYVYTNCAVWSNWEYRKR